MARIAGVDLPREKRVEIGLTYIYGIGLTTSKQILAATGIDPDTRVKDLDENDVSKLREYIDHNVRVEGELRGVPEKALGDEHPPREVPANDRPDQILQLLLRDHGAIPLMVAKTLSTHSLKTCENSLKVMF